MRAMIRPCAYCSYGRGRKGIKNQLVAGGYQRAGAAKRGPRQSIFAFGQGVFIDGNHGEAFDRRDQRFSAGVRGGRWEAAAS